MTEVAELIAVDREVTQLLKNSDRLDIDGSLILKIYEELKQYREDDEVVITAENVFNKLIELHPEKKCFNECKELTDDEFISIF